MYTKANKSHSPPPQIVPTTVNTHTLHTFHTLHTARALYTKLCTPLTDTICTHNTHTKHTQHRHTVAHKQMSTTQSLCMNLPVSWPSNRQSMFNANRPISVGVGVQSSHGIYKGREARLCSLAEPALHPAMSQQLSLQTHTHMRARATHTGTHSVLRIKRDRKRGAPARRAHGTLATEIAIHAAIGGQIRIANSRLKTGHLSGKKAANSARRRIFPEKTTASKAVQVLFAQALFVQEADGAPTDIRHINPQPHAPLSTRCCTHHNCAHPPKGHPPPLSSSCTPVAGVSCGGPWHWGPTK